MSEALPSFQVGRARGPSPNRRPRIGLPARLTALLLAASLSLLLMAGCSDGRPERVPVAGRVTIDGQPVTKGYVLFVPDGNRNAQGRIDAEGKFRLGTFDEADGAVRGAHRVAVISREVLSPTKIRWLVPQDYVDPRLSPVTVSIDGPTDALEIKLTWDGGKPFVEETQTQGDSDPAAVGKESP